MPAPRSIRSEGSANLKTLGHSVCQRPIYPLDEEVPFAARAEIYP